MFLHSALLLISLVSSVSAQDGFTWWTYPNSTGPITLTVGSTVTLQWVTDYPSFNIILYQNLGNDYANFTSITILEDGQLDMISYDWVVAPIVYLTNSNNGFHFDIALSNNEENGANSQDFDMAPLDNGTFPPNGSIPPSAPSTSSLTFGPALPTLSGPTFSEFGSSLTPLTTITRDMLSFPATVTGNSVSSASSSLSRSRSTSNGITTSPLPVLSTGSSTPYTSPSASGNNTASNEAVGNLHGGSLAGICVALVGTLLIVV
ncbi:MAG: hypothetical protein MMC33_008295 [Icmadophila ericetorum]|nr:hypothetical protein [Icmadophila ericetorum]